MGAARKPRDKLVDNAARAICYGTVAGVKFIELPHRHSRIELERAYRAACSDRTMLRNEIVRLRAELQYNAAQMRALARGFTVTARERDTLRATLAHTHDTTHPRQWNDDQPGSLVRACPACGRHIHLKKNGTLRHHKGTTRDRAGHRLMCTGVGQRPQQKEHV